MSAITIQEAEKNILNASKNTWCKLTDDSFAFDKAIKGKALELGMWIFKCAPFEDQWNKSLIFTMKELYQGLSRLGCIDWSYPTFNRYLKILKEGGYLVRRGVHWLFNPTGRITEGISEGEIRVKKQISPVVTAQANRISESTDTSESQQSMNISSLSDTPSEKCSELTTSQDPTTQTPIEESELKTCNVVYEVVEEVSVPDPIVWETLTKEEVNSQDPIELTTLHPVVAQQTLESIHDLELGDPTKASVYDRSNYIAMLVFTNYLHRNCELSDLSYEDLLLAMKDLPVDWDESHAFVIKYPVVMNHLDKLTYLRTFSDETVRKCMSDGKVELMGLTSEKYRKGYAICERSQYMLRYGSLRWLSSLMREFNVSHLYDESVYYEPQV